MGAVTGLLKQRLRASLPPRVYDKASLTWKGAAQGLPALWTVFRHGVPEMLLLHGPSIGDDLLCTAVLKELRKSGRRSVWMMSAHREIFWGSEDVERVVPINLYLADLVKRQGGRCFQMEYAPFDQASDRSTPPAMHIIAEMCAQVGVRGEISLRPYFKFRDSELVDSAWAKDCIVMQSSGLAASFPMLNKQWFPERFQAVADALRRTHRIVQIGSSADPPLQGVDDLRGRTTLRQSAAILANARLFVGSVGFPMHLSRAVDCPAVIVYGGREAPWQSGYVCNTNIYTSLECSPCWRWNTCDYGRRCMTDISASAVIDAVHARLDEHRDPLPVETVLLP